MHILGSGRDAFLEFLRNLTPQALLFTSAFVIAFKIKQPLFTWQNLEYFGLILCLLAIMLGAVAANAWKFLDNAFSRSEWARAKKAEIEQYESAPWRRSWLFLTATWHEKRIMFFEFVVAVAVTYSCLIAVMVMATSTALRNIGER